MKVVKVSYTRLKALKDYENERAGVELEVNTDLGETVQDAFLNARRLVNNELGIDPTKNEIEAAKKVLREAGEL